MLQYNVPSFASKTDIIEPELTNFDIISLTETTLYLMKTLSLMSFKIHLGETV